MLPFFIKGGIYMKKTFLKGVLTGIAIASAVIIPVSSFGAGEQTIEAVFGKIKLIVNGSSVNGDTLLYNGTTYVPIRSVADAIGGNVEYDANTYTAAITTDPASTYWANKSYILATSGNINTNRLIISNVTPANFNFEFLSGDNSVLKGTAIISNNSAVCSISDVYGISFEIHGDEITVTETGKAQLFPDSIATYVHKTSMNTATPPAVSSQIEEFADFKEGNYSSGSSQTAKTLIITDVTDTTFKYQVIAANGTDVITEGTASITAKGKAQCEFKDDYTISFTNSGNNVVELTESKQQLFPSGKITFYTT